WGAEIETLIHTLKDFPIARAILSTGGLDNSLITKDYHCCIDWLEDVTRVLDKRVTDFRILNLINDPLLPANPAAKRWEKPPRVTWWRGDKNEMMSAEWAEIYAFEENIKMAYAPNIKIAVVFETDNASLVNRVNHHSTDVTIISVRIKDSIKAVENFKSTTYVGLINVVTWWQISFVKK
ncbi:hypothetical protein Golax_002521, partial [Gossypium laxum]|nr:hypothetical protein [Gossypium laxum]